MSNRFLTTAAMAEALSCSLGRPVRCSVDNGILNAYAIITDSSKGAHASIPIFADWQIMTLEDARRAFLNAVETGLKETLTTREE